MTVPVVLDARIMAYNRTGISRYVRHLYEGMASLRDRPSRGDDPFPIDVTVLSSRRDSEHLLSDAWARSATAWTPPHHCRLGLVKHIGCIVLVTLALLRYV